MRKEKPTHRPHTRSSFKQSGQRYWRDEHKVGIDAEAAYFSSDSQERRAGALAVVRKNLSSRKQLLAGRMCLEIAHDAYDQNVSLDYFTQAQEHLELVASRDKIEHGHDIGKAALLLAHLPHYYWLTLEQKIVPEPLQAKAYEQTQKIARQQYQELAHVPRGSESYTDILGGVSELAVLMLSQRFALKNGDGSWLPVPSQLTEDRGVHVRPGTVSRSSWDISIFTQYETDQPPLLAHKVQVKTSQNKKVYDDVSLVTVRGTLNLPSFMSHPVCSVPFEILFNEFDAEAQGHTDQLQSAVLDTRTEYLLNAID